MVPVMLFFFPHPTRNTRVNARVTRSAVFTVVSLRSVELFAMFVMGRGEAAVPRMTTDTKVPPVRLGQAVMVAGVGVERRLPTAPVLGRRRPLYHPARLVETGQDRRRVDRGPRRGHPVLDRDAQDPLPFAPDARA